MSYSIDVNLLLYASDASGPYHQRALDFLQHSAAQSEVLCLAWTTIMGYLRIATHPAIFARPLSLDEAMDNVEALLRLPQVRIVVEEDSFWNHYRKVVQGLGARGNLVPDAHLAALLKQHGVQVIYTNDSDFRKFPFLRVKNPFEAGGPAGP